MAIIDRAFDVQSGISLGNNVGIFYSATDPSSNGSLDSPKGSLILHVPASGEPQLWKKFGSGATSWKKLQTKTHSSESNPTVTNDGADTAGLGITFEPGDLWINTTTSTGFYICFNNATSAAVWGQAGGAISFEASTSNIKENGSVSVGALSTVPRADHIHPTDTSREPTLTKGNLTTSTGLSVSGGTGAVIGSGAVISLPQAIGTSNSPTFADVTISNLNRNFVTYGTDTKMATGVPFTERGKFRVAFTYSAPNIIATISFVGANTSFSYYINGKKFTVTATELSAYTKSATAAEGAWYFYINQSTTDVASPVLSLSKTAWTIYDPDVLLWNAYFNASDNTITWVGEERHAAGRDIYNHARNHAQGAIYKSGLLFSQYNGLTTFSSNTDNNFGRAQTQISGGSFFDEDIQNTIAHTDGSLTSSTSSPHTDWNLTVNQFLGFTELAIAGTNATTIVFPSDHSLVTGQAVTVMQGNTTTIRGTTTISISDSGVPSFSVSSVTGMTTGDAIVIGARIPIYYISAVAGGVYTWRRLAVSDFLGVSGGAGITTIDIASATCQYNNATSGGFSTMTANRYYPMYLLATNMTSQPVIAILGQGQSTNATLATALAEAAFQFANLAGLQNLGIQEVVPFYRLTFHYNTTGAFNANHMRLVDATFLNVRVATVSGSVLGSPTTSVSASQSNTDTTNFNAILTTSETTVQAALDRIDDYAEPVIGAKGTAFNKNFETSTGNIKVAGSVSVGVLDTLPRADHVHPAGSATVTTDTTLTGDGSVGDPLGVQLTYASQEDVFTATASQTSFVLTSAPASVVSTLLSIDGAVQNKNCFTLATNTLTYTGTALTGGETVTVKYAYTILYPTSPFIPNEDIFTATASQSIFTLSQAPIDKKGIILIIDAAVSASDQFTLVTNTLTMNTALVGGEKVVVKYNSQIAATSDPYAIHDNESGEISAITEKTVPVSADLLIAEDSAASNAKKKLQLGNLGFASSNSAIKYNAQTISANQTIPSGQNAVSAGPITIADSCVVIISDGSSWVIV